MGGMRARHLVERREQVLIPTLRAWLEVAPASAGPIQSPLAQIRLEGQGSRHRATH